jgi:hypothetical protein
MRWCCVPKFESNELYFTRQTTLATTLPGDFSALAPSAARVGERTQSLMSSCAQAEDELVARGSARFQARSCLSLYLRSGNAGVNLVSSILRNRFDPPMRNPSARSSTGPMPPACGAGRLARRASRCPRPSFAELQSWRTSYRKRQVWRRREPSRWRSRRLP